ncbi:bacterial regulatory s, tetR family protein [Mycobacterium xenopi 3993]|nr:bacterial regulatory s, tetR family protein [Mycobacterium xenopi 3993]
MSVADHARELAVCAPYERGDAARNRALLLDAARRLIGERGAEAVTTDDIAAAAGVGKGTVFRRFGSRAGLMMALLDDDERHLQQAFLFGPPPLGPDAPRWSACWRSAAKDCASSTPTTRCSPRPTAIRRAAAARRPGCCTPMFGCCWPPPRPPAI